MARLREDSTQALTGQSPLSQQSAGTIIAFLAHALAHGLGRKLQVQAIEENGFQINFRD
jgi:hypothetical protein